MSKICWSYKLVKGHRHKNKLPLPVSPSGDPNGEISERSNIFIYKTTNFNADCVDFF